MKMLSVRKDSVCVLQVLQETEHYVIVSLVDIREKK